MKPLVVPLADFIAMAHPPPCDFCGCERRQHSYLTVEEMAETELGLPWGRCHAIVEDERSPSGWRKCTCSEYEPSNCLLAEDGISARIAGLFASIAALWLERLLPGRTKEKPDARQA